MILLVKVNGFPKSLIPKLLQWARIYTKMTFRISKIEKFIYLNCAILMHLHSFMTLLFADKDSHSLNSYKLSL